MLHFFEVDRTDELDVADIVLTMAGGPYQEYFYVEVPNAPAAAAAAVAAGAATHTRFLYVHDESNPGNTCA